MNVTVFTRHSADCPKKSDKYWKRCKCPKWLSVSDDRGFTRHSAKTRSWDKAERKAKAIEQQPARQAARTSRPTESSKRKTIESAVEKFLKNKKCDGVDEGTYYNQDLAIRKQFLGWAKGKSLVYLDEVTLEDLEDFRATLPGNAVTRRYKQTLLRGFFRYCALHSEWGMKSNPALGLSRIKVNDEPTGYFDREEFAAVRMTAANYYRRQDLPCAELNARLLAFVDCLRWSGLRIGDVIKLQRTRLDAKNRIQLHQEKTKVHVFVPIPAPVAEAMRMLPGDRYFFWDGHNYPGAMRNYQYALKTVFKKAGVPQGHAHMLRDTFAVELLLAGMPLEQVSKLLGHTSIKTTEKHYGPWVKARQQQLEANVQEAWSRMAAPDLEAGRIVQ